MNSQIKKDLYRYIGSDCNNLFKQVRYILFTPGFQYIYIETCSAIKEFIF